MRRAIVWISLLAAAACHGDEPLEPVVLPAANAVAPETASGRVHRLPLR
jgi:hypothetical protein